MDEFLINFLVPLIIVMVEYRIFVAAIIFPGKSSLNLNKIMMINALLIIFSVINFIIFHVTIYIVCAIIFVAICILYMLYKIFLYKHINDVIINEEIVNRDAYRELILLKIKEGKGYLTFLKTFIIFNIPIYGIISYLLKVNFSHQIILQQVIVMFSYFILKGNNEVYSNELIKESEDYT